MHQALNFPSPLMIVKSVLQMMSSYMFSVLSSPKMVIKKIRAIQRNFLWGSMEIKQKWALVDWEMVYRPRRARGLGLRDLEIANKVLSAKIWWWWVTHKGGSWASFWHHKYARGWSSHSLVCYDQNITRSPI